MIESLKFKNICYISKKIKVYNYIRYLICILFLVLICLFIFDYEKTYITYGYIIKEDNYYIKLNINFNNIEELASSNIVIINNKKYTYEVINISEELFINSQYENYKEVIIEINEEKEYIENEVIKLSFIVKKQKIIKVIYQYFIKKG